MKILVWFPEETQTYCKMVDTMLDYDFDDALDLLFLELRGEIIYQGVDYSKRLEDLRKLILENDDWDAIVHFEDNRH